MGEAEAGYVREKYQKGKRGEGEGQRQEDGSGSECIGLTSDGMKKGEDQEHEGG